MGDAVCEALSGESHKFLTRQLSPQHAACPQEAVSRNQPHRKLSESKICDSDVKHTCNGWLTQRQLGPPAENKPGQPCGSKQNVTVVEGALCTSPVVSFETCSSREQPTRPSTVPSLPNLDASLRDLRQLSARTLSWPVEQHTPGSSAAAPHPLADVMHLAGRVQGTVQQQQQLRWRRQPPQKQAVQWTQTALPRAQPPDRLSVPVRPSFGELQPVPEIGSFKFVPRHSFPGYRF